MNIRNDREGNVLGEVDFPSRPSRESHQAAEEDTELFLAEYKTETRASTNRLREEVCEPETCGLASLAELADFGMQQCDSSGQMKMTLGELADFAIRNGSYERQPFKKKFDEPDDSGCSHAGPGDFVFLELSDSAVILTLSQKDRAWEYAKVLRRHLAELFRTDGLEAAIERLDFYTCKVEAVVAKHPKLRIFLTFLYGTFAWIVKQASPEDQGPHLDRSIENIRQAIELSTKIREYPRFERVDLQVQLLNLLLDRECNSDASDATLIEDTVSELKEFLTKALRKKLMTAEIRQNCRVRIALANYHYSLLGQDFLGSVLKQKKLLIEGLEIWLRRLYPKLKKSKLEHESKPYVVNWNRFEIGRLEKAIETFRWRVLKPFADRSGEERSRFTETDIEETKSQCRKMLYKVAKCYSKLGQHSAAHCILRIADGYGRAEDDQTRLNQDLAFVLDIAEIEEKENLFKAIDRLEIIVLNIERHNLARSVRLPLYRYTLARLYGWVGLKDLAVESASRCIAHPRTTEDLKKKANVLLEKLGFESIDNPVEEPRVVAQLVSDVNALIEQRNPDIIFPLADLSEELISSEQPDVIDQKLPLLAKKLRKVTDWLSFGEDRGEVGWLIDDSTWIGRGTLDCFAELFAKCAAALSIIYRPNMTPRLLLLLHKAQKKAHKDSQIASDSNHTLLRAAKRAAELGDWVHFLEAFKLLRPLIEDGEFSQQEIANLLKKVIALAERALERVPFPKERSAIVETFAPQVEYCVFKLANIETTDKERWLFRGANVLKCRLLTAIRQELPSRYEFGKEAWLELRKLLLEEIELRTTKTDEETDEDYTLIKPLLEKKYELFTKMDSTGIPMCSPRILKEVLTKFLPKKICLLSFLTSQNNQILVVGVSNYNAKIWFQVIEPREDTEDIVNGCWHDIFFSSSHDNLKLAFERIMEPLVPMIYDSDLLYIVPDSVLHRLPFHALCGSIDNQEQYVIEKFEVGYIHSPLLLWQLLSRETQLSGSSLAVGCLSKDIDWEEKRKTYQTEGFQVSSDPAESFQELSRGYYTRPILYVIGHGYPCSDSPLHSYIALVCKDDSTLEVKPKDFLEIGPRARFVFLNSCYSGNSEAFGTDVIGFPFCILGGGNPSCCVAAVPVDIEFASHFGQGVIKGSYNTGKDLSTVIASTIRENMSNPSNTDWRLPRYWAPYFFYGDFRQLLRAYPAYN